MDHNPFTEVETHFVDAKGYVVREAKYNDVKSTKSDKITSKRVDAAVRKAKVDTKELYTNPNLTEGKIMSLTKKFTFGFLYLPKVKKEEVKSSYLQEKNIKITSSSYHILMQ